MTSFDTEVDAVIASTVKVFHPTLYNILVELIRRGEQPETIIRRVDRIAGGTLTSHTIAVTVRWLAAQTQTGGA